MFSTKIVIGYQRHDPGSFIVLMPKAGTMEARAAHPLVFLLGFFLGVPVPPTGLQRKQRPMCSLAMGGAWGLVPSESLCLAHIMFIQNIMHTPPLPILTPLAFWSKDKSQKLFGPA